MKHLNAAEDVILYLQKFMDNPKTMETYFETDRKNFIRNWKMPFPELLTFLMQKSANSLDIRLKNWAELFGKSSTQTVSRQAVSKSRQDLSAALFRDMLKETAGLILQHREN